MNSLWINRTEHPVPASYAELSAEKQVQVACIAANGYTEANAVKVLYLLLPKGLRIWWHLVMKPVLWSRFSFVLPSRWAEELLFATSLAKPFFDLKADFPCAPGGLVRPVISLQAMSWLEFDTLQDAYKQLAEDRTTTSRARLAAILFRKPRPEPDHMGDNRAPFNEYFVKELTAQAEYWPELYWSWAESWYIRQMVELKEAYSEVFAHKSDTTDEASSFDLIHAIAGSALKYNEALNQPCSYILFDLQKKIQAAKELEKLTKK